MLPDKILESDSLDILFEHRNKMYGAYELRKKYNKRLLMALAMGLLVISIPVVYISLKKLEVISTKPDFKGDIFISPPVSFIPDQPLPKKVEKEKVPASKMKPKAANNTGPLKMVNEDVVEKKPEQTNVIFNNPGNDAGEAIIAPHNLGGQAETAAGLKDILTSTTDADENVALPMAEQMPAYPGGLKALRKFLENNLESPRSLDEGEKINVQVKFIVGYDGNLKSFELVKDGGTIFNKEVIRVLKLMPRWIPGKNAGKNVSVYFSLPVSFVAPE